MDDFYFGDESWKIRYLVARSGIILSGRQFLIGRDLLEEPDLDNLDFPVALSTKDFEDSATTEQVSTVSQQREKHRKKEMLPYWRPFMAVPQGTR